MNIDATTTNSEENAILRKSPAATMTMRPVNMVKINAWTPNTTEMAGTMHIYTSPSHMAKTATRGA